MKDIKKELWHAVANNQVKLVEKLLEQNPDLTGDQLSFDSEGFDIPRSELNPNFLRVDIEDVFRIDSPTNGALFLPPLFIAARKGNDDIYRLLISQSPATESNTNWSLISEIEEEEAVDTLAALKCCAVIGGNHHIINSLFPNPYDLLCPTNTQSPMIDYFISGLACFGHEVLFEYLDKVKDEISTKHIKDLFWEVIQTNHEHIVSGLLDKFSNREILKTILEKILKHHQKEDEYYIKYPVARALTLRFPQFIKYCDTDAIFQITEWLVSDSTQDLENNPAKRRLLDALLDFMSKNKNTSNSVILKKSSFCCVTRTIHCL